MDKRCEERKKRIEYAIQIIKENPTISQEELLIKIMSAFMIGQRYAKEYMTVALYEVKNGNR